MLSYFSLNKTMNELKDYHHHNLDTNKIEYSTNQNENNNTSNNNNNSVVHTTILNTTSNPLTTESSFHPINVDHNKKLTSATGTSSSSSSIPLILPQLLPTSESNSPLHLQSISLQATSSSISNGSAASASISLGDSQRLSEQHQNNHHQQQTHQPHWYSPHHHLSHPHQLEEQNFLVYASNSNKLHDGPDGYLSTRYNNNVKGIRNERTSSNFFDIPAATHHPYCYRFPSPPGLLKKELGEDRYTSHPSTLHLSQHHFHHHHHHHQIEHPDSTTNLSVHQQTLNQTTSSSPTSSPSDIPDYSPYNNGNTGGYTIRPSESAIVSSTEPEIGFGTLYSTCSPISSNNSVNQRRGSLQLWQFLVTLLDEPTTSSGCIAWTGRGMEFKLIEPEEVARRWGLQKNRPAMNYDKLSRSLRYYYEKGIMQKVAGERYVYKFVCDPEALFNMAYGHMNSGTENSYTTSNNSKTINNNINNNNNNNILSITDSHHQHHQNISSSELCTSGGGKLNSMYNNNSFLHNNFK